MSEADKLEKLLDKEKAKQFPDRDIVYALKVRLPYANTIDTEALSRGNKRIEELLDK